MTTTLAYRSAPHGPAYVTVYRADENRPAHINVYLEDWAIGLTIDQYGVRMLNPNDFTGTTVPTYGIDEIAELLAARHAAGGRESKTLDDSNPAATPCPLCTNEVLP